MRATSPNSQHRRRYAGTAWDSVVSICQAPLSVDAVQILTALQGQTIPAPGHVEVAGRRCRRKRGPDQGPGIGAPPSCPTPSPYRLATLLVTGHKPVRPVRREEGGRWSF
jgi:hypothetical protein